MSGSARRQLDDLLGPFLSRADTFTKIKVDALIRGVESQAVERYRLSASGSRVYFAEREGRIKIGFSTQVEARLQNIARGQSMPTDMTPGPVVLLGTCPGDRSLERNLHLVFKPFRIGRTEWFEDRPILRDWIATHTTEGNESA